MKKGRYSERIDKLHFIVIAVNRMHPFVPKQNHYLHTQALNLVSGYVSDARVEKVRRKFKKAEALKFTPQIPVLFFLSSVTCW